MIKLKFNDVITGQLAQFAKNFLIAKDVIRYESEPHILLNCDVDLSSSDIDITFGQVNFFSAIPSRPSDLIVIDVESVALTELRLKLDLANQFYIILGEVRPDSGIGYDSNHLFEGLTISDVYYETIT